MMDGRNHLTAHRRSSPIGSESSADGRVDDPIMGLVWGSYGLGVSMALSIRPVLAPS